MSCSHWARSISTSPPETASPVAIRYPKAPVPVLPETQDSELRLGKAETLVEGGPLGEGGGIALFAYGTMVDEAYRALPMLAENGVRPTLVNARFAKPLDVEMLRDLAGTHHTLFTLEEGVLMGGFGSAVVESLVDEGISFEKIVRIGVPDRFVTFGSRQNLLEECGLDSASIGKRILETHESREAGRFQETSGSDALGSSGAVGARDGSGDVASAETASGGRLSETPSTAPSS